MKRTNRIIMISGMALLSTILIYGQAIDQERMDRDLKIAENILGSLSNGSTRVVFHNDIESSYIPDYGVIFSIPTRSIIYATAGQGVSSFPTTGSNTYVVQSSGSDQATIDVKGSVVDSKSKDDSKSKEMKSESEVVMKEQMTLFLTDYADLISQLKPTDRIVVQARGRSERLFVNGRNFSKGSEGLSAQLLKSDLIAYKQGKIDRDALIDKIQFTSGEDAEVSKDVELFSTIFARLYEPDLSTTYYTSSRSIGYTRLENFGITFNMKVYSSSSDEGLHIITTTGERGLTQEERNEKVNAMYPEFERSFKENLLDYGRTLKSLKPEEMVIFKIELTQCRGCEMPEAIEVTVKGKTLKDYDAGTLSKSKAMELVDVREKRN